MRNFLFCLIISIGVFVLGCSGSGNLSSPVIPDVSNSIVVNKSASSHVLWGMWNVKFTPVGPDSADVELVPMRGAMFNVNVQQFLSPPISPTELLTFEFLPGTDFPSGYINVRVGLRHPFVGLMKYRGFDTRCIFMADGDTYGEYDSEVLYTRPDTGGNPTTGAYLLNPDGYTRWWNYPEFTDPTPLFSYKPASMGTDPEPEATLNPYKYFADDLGGEDPVSSLPIENRGCFSATGSVNSRDVEVQFPVDPLAYEFNLAIDASWADPDPDQAPDFPVESFPPDAQMQEPYLIEGLHTGGTAFYSDSASGGTIEAAVTVYDWQAVGSPSGVLDEITSIILEGEVLTSPVDILPLADVAPGPNEASSVFTVELDNSMLDLTGSGDFLLLGTVESADPTTYMPQIDGGEMFVYPDAPLAAYFMMRVHVSDIVPGFDVMVPNGGEAWVVGSDEEITWTGGDAFDTVNIEYSKDDFVSDINLIGPGVDNTGSWTWVDIPSDSSETVKIRISSTDYPLIQDESNEYFSIIGNLDEMIVYCADGPASGRQIYSIDPEGVGPVEQWTFSSVPAFIECPKLSPCGGYILYTFCDLAVAEIRLINIATGVETVVNPPGKQALYGDFSNDGTKIVTAAADVWWGPHDLWTVDYNGENAEQLTFGADVWAPSYNYDDSYIYYSEFGPSEVRIYDVQNGNIDHYTDNGSWNDDPVGSQDGTQIAWATSVGCSCRRVYISPIGSWSPPDTIIDFDGCVRSPCFSPDGTKMVIDHGSYGGSEIAIYDLTDDTWEDITDNAWGDYMADWGYMIPH